MAYEIHKEFTQKQLEMLQNIFPQWPQAGGLIQKFLPPNMRETNPGLGLTVVGKRPDGSCNDNCIDAMRIMRDQELLLRAITRMTDELQATVGQLREISGKLDRLVEYPKAEIDGECPSIDDLPEQDQNGLRGIAIHYSISIPELMRLYKQTQDFTILSYCGELKSQGASIEAIEKYVEGLMGLEICRGAFDGQLGR